MEIASGDDAAVDGTTGDVLPSPHHFAWGATDQTYTDTAAMSFPVLEKEATSNTNDDLDDLEQASTVTDSLAVYSQAVDFTPAFDNEEDVAARLFSPDRTTSEEVCNADKEAECSYRRTVQLSLAQNRIEAMARLHCEKLAVWAASIRLATIHYGLPLLQDSNRMTEEVNCITYTSLEQHALSESGFTKPTIITGPFLRLNNHKSKWRTNVRDFTGAQIQVSGDTWLRSLRGTQLCMIVLDPEVANAGSVDFNPEGHSTMQAGKIWDASLPSSPVTQSPGMPTAVQLLEVLHVILCIPSQLS
ncbi:hypothetical protein LTR12_018107 [Friedmanniomyces endolithicus]|nr:hypothetical protein LTR74_017676 [Friedmanniomyces endolithicus]KAK1807545.1 hypothetical protein LTR12_018107 [Friedmanniomyces endolithicus]